MIDLKNYICALPFTNIQLHKNESYMCCPSWLLKALPNDVPLKDVWNSNEAKDIRKSIIDGDYKYCDKSECPHLSQLVNFGENGDLGPIAPKPLAQEILKDYDYDTGEMSTTPQWVNFSFDRSCNYKCPSCRIGLIVADSKEIKEITSTIEEIEEFYANNIKILYITGTGDPFASVSFRNFLRNFDPKKYPKLEQIHLHTNASLWTKEMWDSMPNIHRYVKTCEISIDAGTKETYENLTRVGGKWETLIENLKFINTIPRLKNIKTSFVVQSHNYKEMKIFLDLMKSIFNKKAYVYFGKILNWGHLSEGEYMLLKVWDKSHPEYSEFLKELNKIWKEPQQFHNLHEFINVKKTIV